MRCSLLMVLACVALVSCASPEEKARLQAEFEISECEKLGFKVKSEQFAQCRLQIRSIRAQEDSARATKVGVAQQNYWNTYRAYTQPYGR